MIRAMQKRFIRISLAVLTAAILAVTLTINFANLAFLQRDIRETADTIFSSRRLQRPLRDPNRQRPEPEPDEDARYMLVVFRGEGDDVDLTNVTSRSGEEAIALAKQALESGKLRGLMDNWYYVVQENEETPERGDLPSETVELPEPPRVVMLLNCQSRLRGVRMLAVLSLISCVVSISAAWFFVSLFSRRAILPMLENDRKQKRFITDASHELKTPLSVISANMEVLELEDGANEWIASTQRQVGQMRRMIADMIVLARSDESFDEGELLPVDLSRIVRETAEPFTAAAEIRGQTLSIEAEEGLKLRGQAGELSMVVSVLCDNAVKYAPEGDKIVLRLMKKRKFAVLETENALREPLPPEKLAHLFDRFYRADEARTRDGSSGIGLAIAMAISQKYGGTGVAETVGDRLRVSCRFRPGNGLG